MQVPHLPILIGMDELVAGVNYRDLADALGMLILTEASSENLLQNKGRSQLLWLLACFVYFRRWANRQETITSTPDAQYVKVVSRLISHLADDIENRIDISQPSSESTNTSSAEPLPEFVRSEIATLVNQENVNGLLANLDVNTSASSEDASALASYALMLLRVFPRRGDEIRLSLYRGSTSGQSGRDEGRLPATKYFYQAASRTQIFKEIIRDPRATVNLLKPAQHQGMPVNGGPRGSFESRNQQWRVILLFLELYTFSLRVMDDEEFLTGSTAAGKDTSSTRQSALPLDQVEKLTVFLKNLTFAMYWNASEIAGIEAKETHTSLAAYFGRASDGEIEQDVPKKRTEMSIAGVSGLTIEHVSLFTALPVRLEGQ